MRKNYSLTNWDMEYLEEILNVEVKTFVIVANVCVYPHGHINKHNLHFVL